MKITKVTERWFPCPDDPDNGKILIKSLSPGERQDIFDKTMPQKVEYEADDDGNLIPSFSMDSDRALERDLTLKACVVDWESFYDEDGEPLECTPKNIIRARREIEGFFEFVSGCRAKLDSDIAKELEDQEKNLPNSASE